MSTRDTVAYTDWKAPAEDGEFLIWPDVRALIEQTRGNRAHLGSAQGMIQNLRLSEVRDRLRGFLNVEPDRPLIATGHQIELYHAGVWAKNVFINELAAKTDGVAFHFAVDTDAPKHLVLRWPGGAEPITDDFHLMSADFAEMLEAPTPAHLAEVERSFDRAASGWGFRPMLSEFFSALRRGLLDSSGLPRVLVNASHQIDWELGLRHHALLASPLWRSPGYLAFAHHLLARAGEFASVYNAALAEYRGEQGIRNSGRPWPDLRVGPEQVEAPFWFDALTTGQRARGSVSRRGEHWTLRADGEPFDFDPSLDGWTAADRMGQFLRTHNLRLSPRALTLTAFLRLCVADQFVHGIGGARYDRITDRVIERFFSIAPPSFCVTTATLLFPTAVGQERIDVESMKREGRRLRHSLPDTQKQGFLDTIRALPRSSHERRDVFFEMHRGLGKNLVTEAYKAWERRLADAQRVGVVQRELFDRELFYALQPRERLQSLIDRYHQAE